MTRPQLSHHAWLDAEKTQEIPVPLIRYGDKQAVADEYHVEIWGADDNGDKYTANLAIIKDGKIVDYVYGHRYTDADFIEWTLIPMKLSDYLRRSSFGKQETRQ